MENWKTVQEYEGLYEVSDLGRVRSLYTESITKTGKIRQVQGRILKINQDAVYKTTTVSKKYYTANLYDSTTKISKKVYVHRLMAFAFIDVPDRYNELDLFDLVVDHIDNDSTNNKLSNLQWLSRSENTKKDQGTDSIKIRIIETAQIFESQTDLVKYLWKNDMTPNKDLGGVIANIRNNITNDKSKHAYGYTYEYVEEK